MPDKQTIRGAPNLSPIRDISHSGKVALKDENQDFEPFGFEWIDCNGAGRSVVSFIRWRQTRTT
jgi:hypothetical protein